MDEKYDATHRAAITPGVALWAAVSFSTGIRLTDDQVERALRSLEENNWRLVGPAPSPTKSESNWSPVR